MKFEVHVGVQSEFAPGPELARLLRELADRVEGGVEKDAVLRLIDTNGRRVGFGVLQEAAR